MASHNASHDDKSLSLKENDSTIEYKPSAQQQHKEPPKRKFIPLPHYELDWAKEFASGLVFHSDQCQCCKFDSLPKPYSQEYISEVVSKFFLASSPVEPQVEKPTGRQPPKPPKLVKYEPTGRQLPKPPKLVKYDI